MTFGVNEFLSNISKTGAAKQNLYQCRINPPAKMTPPAGSGGAVDTKHLAFRVDNVDIPGRTLQTINYNTDIGVYRKIPYNAMYIDITTSIICSDDFRERMWFEAWQNMAIGNHSSGQQGFHPSDGQSWGAGFYNDLVGNLIIETYDETGKPGYLVSLEECYPLMMNAMQATWAGADVHKIQITWAYRYFRDKNGTIEFASQVNKGGFFAKSGLGALVGVGAGALAGKLGPKAGALVGGAVGIAGRLAI